jgi:hypothetical protein
MIEQVAKLEAAKLQADAWERLLVAIRDSASNANPDEVKQLAEAYALLTRRVGSSGSNLR